MTQAKATCTPFILNKNMQVNQSFTGVPLNPASIAYPCGFKGTYITIQPISTSTIHTPSLTVQAPRSQSTRPNSTLRTVPSTTTGPALIRTNGLVSTTNTSKSGSKTRP